MLHLVLIIGVLILFAWYLSFLASRLDRLHHRVETSWEHLDALLQKRAAIALEITREANLDPASNYLLRQAAYGARSANMQERSDAESALSQTISILLQPDSKLEFSAAENGEDGLALELQEITASIKRSTVVHLEAVSAARRLRAKALVRFFHLAGHAPAPVVYAFEEESVF